MADRIVVMDAGRIAQVGPPEEVYDRPNSPFVAGFMGAENTLDLEVAPAAGGGRDPAPATRRADPLERRGARRPRDRLFPRRRREARRARRAPRPAPSCCRDGLRTGPIRADIIAMRVAIGDRHFTVTDERYLDLDTASRSALAAGGRCTCSQAPTTREELMRRTLAAALAAARAGVRRPRRSRRSTSSTAGDQNMVDYVKDYLGPKFEKIESGREGARGRHRARRRRLAEDLREARRAAEGAAPRHGTSTSPSSTRRPPARWSNEGLLVPYRDNIADRQARRPATRRRTRSAPTSTATCMPMFHSQIAFAYNPDLVKDAAEDLRRARRVGEEEPEAVRLQRHQGRHVRRRLRVGLGLRPSAATATSSRRARTTPATKASLGQGARRPQGVQHRTS